MDKKTYTLIGIAGVGLLALYVWSKGKQKKNFAKAPSPSQYGIIGQTANGELLFSGPRGIITLPQGVTPYTSATNGHWMACIEGDCIYLTGPSAVGQTQISSL